MPDIEKIVVIKLELDVDKYTSEAVNLNKQISALKKEQKDLKKSGQETSIEYQRNTEILKTLTSQLGQTNKTIQDVTRANNAASGSNEQLRAQLSVLTAEYNKLSQEERENTTAGREMGQNVAALTSTLKVNESAVGDNRRNVGNYEGALKTLKLELKAAKDEMIGLAMAGKADSKEFAAAEKKAGDLKDQIDDVNDATKAMATGSGLGVFKNQLGLVIKDLGDLDFKGAAEKAKALGTIAKGISFKDTIAGAKGFIVSIYEMAAAMFTLPIVWIVAGLAAVAAAFYLVNKQASDAAESQINSIEKIVSGYVRLKDAQIAIRKAAKLDTQKEEEERLKAQRFAIDKQIEVLHKLQDANNGLNEEQAKQLDELRGKQIQNIVEVSNLTVATIQKQSEAKQKAFEKDAKLAADALAKRRAENLKELEEQRRANEERLAENLKWLRAIEDQKIELIRDDETREVAKATLDNARRQQEITNSKADNQVKVKALLSQHEAYERAVEDIRKKYAAQRKADQAKETDELLARIKKDAEAMAKENADPTFKWNKKTLDDKVATDKAIVASAKKREEEIQALQQQSFEFTKQAIDAIVAIENNRTQAEIENISEATKIKLDNLQREADTGVITAQELEIERARIEMDAAKETSALKKKQWELQKKASLIQVAISTAQGVANALTVQPAYMAAAQVAFALATGGLQAQVINSQPTPAFAHGGKATISGQRVSGSHGSSKFFGNGDTMVAAIRAGEVVLNERQQALLGGSRTFQRIGVPGFADGGAVGRFVSAGVERDFETQSNTKDLIASLPAPVVVVQDINDVQGRVARVEDRANI